MHKGLNKKHFKKLMIEHGNVWGRGWSPSEIDMSWKRHSTCMGWLDEDIEGFEASFRDLDIEIENSTPAIRKELIKRRAKLSPTYNVLTRNYVRDLRICFETRVGRTPPPA